MTPTPQGLPESLGLHSQLLDLDPSETQEWLESRAADQGLQPLERRRHGPPRTTAGHRRGRTHLHVRLGLGLTIAALTRGAEKALARPTSTGFTGCRSSATRRSRS